MNRWTRLPGWLLATAAAAFAVEGSFDRTLSLAGPAELDLRTGAGRIEVRPGEPGKVRIHGAIRANNWRGAGGEAAEAIRQLEANPPIEQSGNVIRAGRRGGDDWQRYVSISYEVTAPPGTAVRASAGSGRVIVEGLGGPVSAETGSGSVALAGPQGEVRASAGSGRIEITGLKGSLRARAGSGSIAVDGEPAGDWMIQTGSGNVRLRMPATAGFELRAQTGSGRVTCDHPLTIRGSFQRRALSGQVGAGGPAVHVRTGSGNVRIE